MEDLGLDQRIVVTAHEIRTDAEAAAHLTLHADEPLFYLERLRLADGIPLAVARVPLPATIGAPLLGFDFSHTALYDELAKRDVSLTAGEEPIRAILPDRADSPVAERNRWMRDSSVGLALETQQVWVGTLVTTRKDL